jgi:hypothetical protein
MMCRYRASGITQRPVLQNPPEEKAPVTKTLAPEVMKRLDRLHELQKQYAEERAKCIAERKALEAKYATVYAELYKQRTDVITGVVDPAEGAYNMRCGQHL